MPTLSLPVMMISSTQKRRTIIPEVEVRVKRVWSSSDFLKPLPLSVVLNLLYHALGDCLRPQIAFSAVKHFQVSPSVQDQVEDEYRLYLQVLIEEMHSLHSFAISHTQGWLQWIKQCRLCGAYNWSKGIQIVFTIGLGKASYYQSCLAPINLSIS